MCGKNMHVAVAVAVPGDWRHWLKRRWVTGGGVNWRSVRNAAIAWRMEVEYDSDSRRCDGSGRFGSDDEYEYDLALCADLGLADY